MKIEFEGQLIENLDQFWVNWQHLGYEQACENWEMWREYMDLDSHNATFEDFIRRHAGDLYLHRKYTERTEFPVYKEKYVKEDVYKEVLPF